MLEDLDSLITQNEVLLEILNSSSTSERYSLFREIEEAESTRERNFNFKRLIGKGAQIIREFSRVKMTDVTELGRFPSFDETVRDFVAELNFVIKELNKRGDPTNSRGLRVMLKDKATKLRARILKFGEEITEAQTKVTRSSTADEIEELCVDLDNTVVELVKEINVMRTEVGEFAAGYDSISKLRARDREIVNIEPEHEEPERSEREERESINRSPTPEVDSNRQIPKNENSEEDTYENSLGDLKLLRKLIKEVPDFLPSSTKPRHFIKKMLIAKECCPERLHPKLLKSIVVEKLFDHAENTTIKSFKELEKHISNFLEMVSTDDLEEQFSNLRQEKGETVAQFAEKLQTLVLKIKELKSRETPTVSHHINTEWDRKLLTYFRKGINTDIRILVADIPDTFAGWVQSAKSAEKEYMKREKARDTGRPKCDYCQRIGHWKKDCRAFRGAANTPGSSNTSASTTTSVTCTYCKLIGHLEENCYRKKGVCYNCKEVGHLSKDCPKPRTVRSQDAVPKNP